MRNLLILFFLFCSFLFAQVDINSASKKELMGLKGIGEVKAEAIIAYRNAHGGFKSVDEIVNVTGIGQKTLEDIKGEAVAQ